MIDVRHLETLRLLNAYPRREWSFGGEAACFWKTTGAGVSWT
jgi:hypothetical protein